MSVCEFIEHDDAELLVYRLISIIIAMRTWSEVLEFGNDFYSKTHSDLGKWIIRQYLIENTNFRFKHINTTLNMVTIFYMKLNATADVIIRDKTKDFFCTVCEKTDCDHVKFVFKIPEIEKESTDPDLIKILQKRGRLESSRGVKN